MSNKKRVLLLVGVMMFSVFFTGCQKAEETNVGEVDKQVVETEEITEVDEDENDEELIQLSEWEGTWNNIVAYLDDEELEEAFEELAERENMSVEETKSSYMEDRKVDFHGLVIEGDKATFLDGFKDKGGEKIVEIEYKYKEMAIAKHGNFDTEWYAFEAEEDGDYEFLLLMPVHGEEALTHFHLRYGNSIEELLAMEDWYPTFVKPNSTYDQLYEEITE